MAWSGAEDLGDQYRVMIVSGDVMNSSRVYVEGALQATRNHHHYRVQHIIITTAVSISISIIVTFRAWHPSMAGGLAGARLQRRVGRRGGCGGL